MRPPSIEPAQRLALDVHSIGLTDEGFYQLCRDNPDLRIELTAKGELILMSPSGARTGHRESNINLSLAAWSKTDGTGIAFGSSAGFTLPNGAKRAPDASWMRLERWNQLTADEQEVFSPVCPDFVVELRSPSDTVAELKEKLSEYIANGARLGWLLDPMNKTAYVYRPGQEPQRLDNPDWIEGETVLPGFRFNFQEIV